MAANNEASAAKTHPQNVIHPIPRFLGPDRFPVIQPGRFDTWTASTAKDLRREPPALFRPLKFNGGLELKNRVMVSPMCTYSCEDGLMNAWHLSHLGQFAIRGVGLIIFEATGVTPEGRITPSCPGIWKDEHIVPMKTINDFCHSFGAKTALQLAHAGRKASCFSPFHQKDFMTEAPVEEGGWPDRVFSPTDEQPWPTACKPKALTKSEIADHVESFAAAAQRALKADFDAIEIHAAHGYLLHSFYSPLSNTRTDEYGGSFENRTRFLIEVVRAVRAVWPKDRALFVRLSVSDHHEQGWTVEDNTKLSKQLYNLGVDLIDCSSGGAVPTSSGAVIVNYTEPWNLPGAVAIKKEVAPKESFVGVVGGITDPKLANDLIETGKTDVVLIARGFLRNANWVIDAAAELGAEDCVLPAWQYMRAQKNAGAIAKAMAANPKF
ncbi:oxidoreductase, FAD/FMN-binding protein [Cladochytrium replicatum]|nr:oxidoreductase, FAD/FMN-binding protein [Cladochytrium replicatum]